MLLLPLLLESPRPLLLTRLLFHTFLHLLRRRRRLRNNLLGGGICVGLSLEPFHLACLQLHLLRVGHVPLPLPARLDLLLVLLHVLRLLGEHVRHPQLPLQGLVLQDGGDVIFHALNLLGPFVYSIRGHGALEDRRLHLAAALLAQLLHLGVLVRAVDRHGPPRAPHPGGAADSVDVAGGVHRQVEVDHRLHVGQVQPSGRKVGGNQKVGLALLEALEPPHPVALLEVAVDFGEAVPAHPQDDRYAVGRLLGGAKYDDPGGVVPLAQTHENRLPHVLRGGLHKLLLQCLRHLACRVCVHPDGLH
mmetsp:Transcript_48446/g.149816  ORF Transcript_48446/g.149816 Transcript_48446/m.149816 type:complete len:304 (+) Transcript_48446:444-1355(+)